MLDFTISIAFTDLGSILIAELTIKLFKTKFLILNFLIKKVKVSEAHNSRFKRQFLIKDTGALI